MYPRLKLARDLLKDDRVIFISIDDKAPQTMTKKRYDDEVAFDDSAGQREKVKIDCARKFFDSLANELKGKNIKVIYKKRLNKQNLNDILKSTLAK